MSAAHDAVIKRILDLNPGLTFGVPDAFWGNRPIYISDGPGQAQRIATKSWLMDPEGVSGSTADFLAYNLTPAPTDPTVFGKPWLLPASTGPGNSPNDQVGTWGWADPQTGALTWYTIHRDGTIIPLYDGQILPPAWAIAQSPYQLTQFDMSRSEFGTNTTPAAPPVVVPSVTPGQQTTPAGTPITGDPNDRYLVGGTMYDGLGHVLSVTPLDGSARGSGWLPLALAAIGLYAFTRSQHSRR